MQEPPAKRPHTNAPDAGPDEALASAGGRDAFMAQHVHRRLHAQAAALPDYDLVALGRLSFNDQFPVFEEPTTQDQGSGGPDIFGGIGRQAFMSSKVHRRLHGQAAQLSDDQLLQLGNVSFNQQFDMVSKLTGGQAATRSNGNSSGGGSDGFGGRGRDGYMHERIHRRLHPQASSLSDEQLLALGKLSFTDQFPALEQLANRYAQADRESQVAHSSNPGLFGGGGRSAYIDQRVHRKLHHRVAGLGDQELFDLGKMTFNEQFDSVDRLMANIHANTGDMFGGLGRDSYTHQRIHRRLHPQAALLDDEELLELGKLSFNDQFPYMEERAPSLPQQPRQQVTTITAQHRAHSAPPRNQQQQAPYRVAPPVAKEQAPQNDTDFGEGIGREDYIRLRVHKRLHPQAADLGDQDLVELGKLTFTEQFKVLDPNFIQQSPSTSSTPARYPPKLFDGLSREEHIQQRINSDLHAAAAQLTDDQVYELASHPFDAQFFVVSQMAPHLVNPSSPSRVTPSRSHAPASTSGPRRVPPRTSAKDSGGDPFQGRDRHSYMQDRVHKKLHGPAAALTDQELADLGSMNFKEQFPTIGEMLLAGDDWNQSQQTMTPGSGGEHGIVELFKGLDRDSFFMQRVHKKIQNQVAHLSDIKLDAFGKLSFNDQFLVLERATGVQPENGGQYSAQTAAYGGELAADFGGMSREQYLQARVHRKLHALTYELSDEALMEVGRMKFNDQFGMFEGQGERQERPAAVNAGADGDLFGGLGREGYIKQRLHRRLLHHAALLNDQELYDIGQLSFNQQFPALGEAA